MKTAVTSYDGVVLERDLPGAHGDEVCAAVAGGMTDVVMLTASAALYGEWTGRTSEPTSTSPGRSPSRSSWLASGPLDVAESSGRPHARGRRPPARPPELHHEERHRGFGLTYVVFAAAAKLAGYVLVERSQQEPVRERIEVALTVIAGERGVLRGDLDDLTARLSGRR